MTTAEANTQERQAASIFVDGVLVSLEMHYWRGRKALFAWKGE